MSKTAVREDVTFLKDNILFCMVDHISGWICDVDTGKVKKINWD